MKLEKILHYVVLAGVFLLPFVPFLVASSMFFPFITGKNFAFRIIVELVVGAWVALAFFKAEFRPRRTWLFGAFAFFLIIIGIADFLGPNPFKSFWSNFERMEGYITLLHLFAYFIVVSTVLNTEKLWTAFWGTNVGASVIMGAVGLGQFFPVIMSGGSLPRIDATLGNPIYLAVYCLFNIFIAAHLFLGWRKNSWIRPLLAVAMVYLFVIMLLTLTRGTVIGFIGGLVLATIIVALFEREHPLLRKTAMGVIVALFLVIGGFLAIKDTHFAQTAPVISRFATLNLSSGTVASRLKIWHIAWQGVKERPILGWGQEGFVYVFDKYYDPRMYDQEQWFDRTHDFVFDWLTAGGFLGLIAYLLIPLTALYYLWLYNRKEPRFSVLERAIWTGLIAGYLFHNLFVFDNIVSYIFYMTVLAYIAWRSGVTTRVWIGKNEVEERSVYTMVLPTVLVVTLVVLYVANYKGIATATTLLQALTQQQGGIENNLHLYQEALAYNSLGRQEVAEQTVQIANQVAGATTVDTKTQQQFFTLAVNAMNAELARNPDSARLQLFTGSLLSRYGRNQEALTYLEKARQLSPTKQTVLFQLGEVYLTLGKTVEAEATMKEAFELDTAYDEARKLYALTALYAGDKAASNAVLLEGFGTTTINDDRFLAAYANSNRFDLVVAVWKMRIAANPTDVQSHVSLAAAYIKLGMRQEAIQELQTVATLNPAFQSQVDTFIADIRAGKDPTNTTTTP